MRVGFLLNPIAGMGGRVGLKGTDGKLAEARERGAEPRAPDRARRALSTLHERDPTVELVTPPDPMGVAEARAAGFDPVVVSLDDEHDDDRETGDDNEHDERSDDGSDTSGGSYTGGDPGTTPTDTARAVRAFLAHDVDCVLFVGGDGTAADVATALSEASSETPMLGVPAGVKVYSSVFGVSPEDAAVVATEYGRTERREVTDIDEDDYREGEVTPTLQAVAFVPVTERVQSSKQTAAGTVESLAEGVADEIRANPERTYVLGPGSTLGAVKAALGFDGSPIGVDLYRDGEVLALDADETTLLDHLASDGDNEIIVTPIGGQGFVFGRGNPQLSPAVIRRCETTVVASREKLNDLPVLRVDTDDPALDEELRGWIKVRIGRFETRMTKLV